MHIDEIAELLDEPLLEEEYFAAVGIVRIRDRWLLGLSTASDDRHHLWCFPGGGIKGSEGPEAAAVREVKEETGIKSKAVSGVLNYNSKPGVAFVVCRADYSERKRMQPNAEFSALGLFTRREMKSLKLYKNVLPLLDRAVRYR